MKKIFGLAKLSSKNTSKNDFWLGRIREPDRNIFEKFQLISLICLTKFFFNHNSLITSKYLHYDLRAWLFFSMNDQIFFSSKTDCIYVHSVYSMIHRLLKLSIDFMLIFNNFDKFRARRILEGRILLRIIVETKSK